MNVLRVDDPPPTGERDRIAGTVEQGAIDVDPETLEQQPADLLLGCRIEQRVIPDEVVTLAACRARAPCHRTDRHRGDIGRRFEDMDRARLVGGWAGAWTDASAGGQGERNGHQGDDHEARESTGGAHRLAPVSSVRPKHATGPRPLRLLPAGTNECFTLISRCLGRTARRRPTLAST